jgi:[CysO sulfur-carrier protein]-S-L-cysteine hydrolase
MSGSAQCSTRTRGLHNSGRLIIARSHVQAIIAHCIAGLPNEACGILAGNEGRVEFVYVMENAKPGPSYYEMQPEEQFRVMKDIRQKGLVMVGMFHSHPSGQAFPSSVDVEKAYWPGTKLSNYPEAVYVIVSLLDRTKPVVRGFTIDEGTIAEVLLSVPS